MPSRSCEFRAFWKRSVDCFKVLLVWPREARVTSVTGVTNWMRDGRHVLCDGRHIHKPRKIGVSVLAL